MALSIPAEPDVVTATVAVAGLVVGIPAELDGFPTVVVAELADNGCDVVVETIIAELHKVEQQLFESVVSFIL